MTAPVIPRGSCVVSGVIPLHLAPITSPVTQENPMSLTPLRRTHTIASQEFVIPAAGGTVPVTDVSEVVNMVTTEAQQIPDAGLVWMRPDGDSIVVGYTTETSA